MLKIQEFAESKNVSNNAIYKAIRREGYAAKDLTDKRGNITVAGFKILRRMYPDEIGESKQMPEQTEQEEKETELRNLRQQLSESRERAEKWEKLYLELQERTAQERTEMQQQLKASQYLLAQQQEINSRLLMNPFRRLFAGKKKEPNING